jgi:uncharacterized protein (DUF58 family)
MVTARGWWFLLIVSSVAAFGTFDGRWPLSLLGLTLLFWFFGSWLMFCLRVLFALPDLRIRREVGGKRGAVDTFWADQVIPVRVEARLGHWLGLPHVRIADHVPFAAEVAGGATRSEAALSPPEVRVLTYRIRCKAAGILRFAGVSVEVADLQGFFYHAAFLHGESVYRVLPALTDALGHRPTVKRDNILPSPGIHRHLQPGSGSELLDLRDYRPGDPPKTIAWRISARRDRLITKEFENEVPMRCTLFIDVSHSVRVGPPGKNALARLVDIAAAVAQATAANRDLTGLCLFDEKQVKGYVRPARGSGHLVKLLSNLAEAAALAPATGQAPLADLLPRAYALAQKVHPELLRPVVNQVPPGLPWSSPVHSREVLWGGEVLRRIFLVIAFLPLVLAVVMSAWLGDAFYPLIPVFLPIPESLFPLVAIGLIASLAILQHTLASVGYRAVSALLPPRRRHMARWRKQLAAVLSELHGAQPAGLGALLENDNQLALHLQQFLADHQVPYPLPFYDRHGKYLFASSGKINVLARALVQAVRKQQDNELFVLMVDLLELADETEPLLRAIKVVLARHHQVLVICPWPPDLPAPSASTGDDWPPALNLKDEIHSRFAQAYRRLHRLFARVRVPFLCAQTDESVRLILGRLDRLRSIGLARRQ